jgi:hypothetical protein
MNSCHDKPRPSFTIILDACNKQQKPLALLITLRRLRSASLHACAGLKILKCANIFLRRKLKKLHRKLP